jgi:alpha,alpha-trehalose phosphorylase
VLPAWCREVILRRVSAVPAGGASEGPELTVEPWRLRELGLSIDELARTESVFALSNGHLGVRGNLEEGEPVGAPGTYLSGFFESAELSYPEKGYAFPEVGQRVVNVTDGKLLRLVVDDDPFDVRDGRLEAHERSLDFRAGTLTRTVEWVSPSGRRVRIRTTRLVSFVQRAVLAIRYEVEPVEASAKIVVQSELLASEPLEPESLDPDPLMSDRLKSESATGNGGRACLIHRTRESELRVAAAFDHVVDSEVDPAARTDLETSAHRARLTVRAELGAGQRLSVTKFVAYGWSAERSPSALRDQVEAALSTAMDTGWEALLAAQRQYLSDFWSRADVELQGDPAIQQAVRFGLFHMLQASARAEGRAVAAKGLTGTGYAGHAFWETEMFVLPVLTATVPAAAADALRWRAATLPAARDWATALGLRGSAYAWRTIRGEECGPYWPAGTAAFHVNADVAAAAARQVCWTDDIDFDRDCALPILVETARLWRSLGYLGADHRFHLDGVTGPDEYSAVVDDNTYTNLMAAGNLLEAAEVVGRWPREAAELEVDNAEVAAWREAAEAMAVPYDDSGMPEQDRGATRRQRWDFATSDRENLYPLHEHVPYFDLYRKQVAKQADLVLALHWCGDRFSLQEKATAFAYYEGLTVRDSSLSASTQAVIAAEVGHLSLAHSYLRAAATVDLQDRKGDTSDGLHMASLAGAWLGLVCGFGGLRDFGHRLRFAPRLPPGIDRLAFAVSWRGHCIHVEVTNGTARYCVDGDADVEIVHHGDVVTVGTGAIELPIPPLTPLTDPPTQPVGREVL